MGVLGGLLAFVFTGGVAFVETLATFQDAPPAWRVCWHRMVGGAALVGILGAALYAVLFLFQFPAPTFWGAEPRELAVALLTIGALEGLGRIEAPKKTVIDGSPGIRGAQESYYSKLKRWIHVHIYRELILDVPETEARPLVLRGLCAAYDFEAMKKEFEDWASQFKNAARRETLLKYAGEVAITNQLSEKTKRDTLVRTLAREDLPKARSLALDRATAIVDQRAL